MSLSEAGDIERGWCHHRFAKMRNFLTKQDLLDWEEEDFVAGVVDDDGRFIPGQAAKWKAGEELMAMMEEAVEPNVDQDEVVLLQEKKGGGESTLYGYNKTAQEHEGRKGEGMSTLYGYNETQPRMSTPSSRQSASFLEEIDRLGIVIPLQKPRFVGYSTGRYRMAA